MVHYRVPVIVLCAVYGTINAVEGRLCAGLHEEGTVSTGSGLPMPRSKPLSIEAGAKEGREEEGKEEEKEKGGHEIVYDSENVGICDFYNEWLQTPGRTEWEKEAIELKFSNFELNKNYQKYLYENDFKTLISKLNELGVRVIDDLDDANKKTMDTIESELIKKDQAKLAGENGRDTNSRDQYGIGNVLQRDGQRKQYLRFNKGEYDVEEMAEYKKSEQMPNLDIAEFVQPKVAYRDYATCTTTDQISKTEFLDPLTASVIHTGADQGFLITKKEEESVVEEESAVEAEEVVSLRTSTTGAMTVRDAMLEVTHEKRVAADDGSSSMTTSTTASSTESEQSAINKWEIKESMLGKREGFTDREIDVFNAELLFLGADNKYNQAGQIQSGKILKQALFDRETFPSSVYTPESRAPKIEETNKLGCRARLKSRLRENERLDPFHHDNVDVRLLITTQGVPTAFFQPGLRYYVMDHMSVSIFFPSPHGLGSEAAIVLPKSEIRRMLFEADKSLFVLEAFAFTAVSNKVVSKVEGEFREMERVQYAAHAAVKMPADYNAKKNHRQLWILDM